MENNTSIQKSDCKRPNIKIIPIEKLIEPDSSDINNVWKLKYMRVKLERNRLKAENTKLKEELKKLKKNCGEFD